MMADAYMAIGPKDFPHKDRNIVRKLLIELQAIYRDDLFFASMARAFVLGHGVPFIEGNILTAQMLDDELGPAPWRN